MGVYLDTCFFFGRYAHEPFFQKLKISILTSLWMKSHRKSFFFFFFYSVKTKSLVNFCELCFFGINEAFRF